MTLWTDKSKTKKDHAGQLLMACKCDICEQCWLRPDLMTCIYGGPYSGYEMEQQDVRP